jgi:hypothetical protein
MALSYFPDLCFIHIPKTGGNYFGKVLFDGFGKPGQLDGYGHGLPRKWNYKRIVTLVRRPDTWIRSMWNHRNGGYWVPGYPSDCPWKDFIAITNSIVPEHTTIEFEDFAWKLVTQYPGIVTWFFNAHIVPGKVEVFTIEDTDRLRQFGNINQEIPNPGKNLPPIPEKLRLAIYKAEREIYEKYYSIGTIYGG